MKQKTTSQSFLRPPIVAVLGHVDHGKTSLLDQIRKSHVAAGEHGGITQHIGAYQIEFQPNVGNGGHATPRLLTFIDTPGHEAFKAMRSRGANVADIALLIVAADDSVKPQTVESIAMIQNAAIPFIVVVNKIDLPTANKEKVWKDLARHSIQVEGFGGSVPTVAVSAKTGSGIPDLLEMILLVGDMQGLSGSTNDTPSGVVIETRKDVGKGLISTIIVKSGIFRRGMVLYDGQLNVGKIRAMFGDNGKPVIEALPGMPIEVLGFNELPEIGMPVTGQPEERKVPTVAVPLRKPIMPSFLSAQPEERKLSILLKGDTTGSLEAIRESLHEKVEVVRASVGSVTESDILEAKSSRLAVIGFNVSVPGSVMKMAQEERVVVRTYKIIYELLDELAEVALNLKEITAEEKELGNARIIAEFPFDGQRIAGCTVSSGRLARGDLVRFERTGTEYARAKIKTIRRGKENVDRIPDGNECGVLFDRKVDFSIGDDIIPISQ